MALPAGVVTNTPTNYFAIGQQSAKDVDATVFYFLKHLSGTGFDTTVDVSSERVGGSGREVGLRYRTKVTADGTFIAYAQPDFAGRVLTLALGQDSVVSGPSVAGGSLGFYSTHSIFSGQSQLPYATVEQAWADEVERTGNCLISSVKLEGEAGKPVKITAMFVTGGTPHSLAGAQNPVREANFPFMVPGGSVAITQDGNPLVAGFASSLQVTKWSVEIQNKLDDAIQTVALNREDVTWLTADYAIDGTFKYINNAFWQQVTYGGGSVVPTGLLANGAFTFYTAEAAPDLSSLTLFAPFVEMSNLKVNRLDPDGMTAYIDFTGATRGIGSTALQCTVVSAASQTYLSSTT